jgi:hypothetical protein
MYNRHAWHDVHRLWDTSQWPVSGKGRRSLYIRLLKMYSDDEGDEGSGGRGRAGGGRGHFSRGELRGAIEACYRRAEMVLGGREKDEL